MPRIVRNQAEALTVNRMTTAEERKKALEIAEELILWSELPATKKQRERLAKEVDELEKKILKGQCKDFAEYIGFTTALKHKLSLEEEIQKQKNIKDRILKTEEKENPKGVS